MENVQLQLLDAIEPEETKASKLTIAEKFKRAAIIGITIFSVMYFGCFCYLNLSKLVELMDSDTAAEALLAREIWNEKSLTPDNWISSTERRIISPATLGAVFYGITSNMNLSMGLACLLIGGLVLISFLYLLRTIKISWLGTAVSVFLLMCLPVNGIQVEGQILPFFTYLIFLFAGYYTPHVIAMLTGLAVYFRIRRGEWRPFLILLGGMIVILVMCLGASGMRCLQIVTMPLVLLELMDLYQSSKRFTVKPDPKRWRATGFTGLVLLSNLFGMMYPSSVQQPIYLQDGSQVISRLTGEVPAAILECLGISGSANLKSVDGLMQLFVYAAIGIIIFACFRICRKGKRQVTQEALALVLFILLSLLFTVGVVSITTIPAYHYYFFIVIFLGAVSIGMLADIFSRGYPVMCGFLLAYILLYGSLNFIYTYVPAMTADGKQSDYKEVVAYMEENEIEYGYAQFWHANRLSAVANGQITIGGVYDMGNLGMYWWLTSTRWYMPDLPEEMVTAYIVSDSENEIFLQGVSERISLKEVLTNDSFIVYVGDRNLVSR